MSRATPPPLPSDRSPARRAVGVLIIGTCTALILGHTLRTPSLLEANDISRWCTVWSLLERGTYVIDECPWHTRTQDKVSRPDPFPPPGTEPVKHYYSSKPPLLPTVIAGMLYPFRVTIGVPLDTQQLQQRITRTLRKPIPGDPSKEQLVTESPDPVKWDVFVFYFKSIIVVLNVIPWLLMLRLYARILDRYAPNDWAWMFCLFAAAWGTQLFLFNVTLNNHTVAAWSAFFALDALIKIRESRLIRDALAIEAEEPEGKTPIRRPGFWTFAQAGFFGAFCACNELPAALFGVLMFVYVLVLDPRRTLLAFVPAAIIPCAGFLITEYKATGGFVPVYAEFGTESYTYEGSYWNTPLEFDWFDKNPEPPWMYAFHMLLGHHGVLSLTPIFLFALWGGLRETFGRGSRLRPIALLTGVISAAVFAFYVWKTHNYGGSTQSLRWLMWLFPFWLVFLPLGLRGAESSRSLRGLSLAALCVSAFSVGYGLRTPWSHPWLVDLLEHLNLYTLVR